MSLKKSIIGTAVVVAVATFGLAAVSSAANLSTNLTWCMTNSGSISVPLNECRSLAYLYSETNGDSRTINTNWFTGTDLTLRKGAYGSGLANALTIAGGHVSGINLSYNNLDGSIFSGLVGLPNLKSFSAAATATDPYLTGVNTSGLSLLSRVDVSYQLGIVLDFTYSTGITYLNLDNTYLDGDSINTYIAQLPNLATLIISRIDYLTGIDLSNNPLLTYLDASLGTMSSIDLSNNPLLTTLLLNNNLFTGIDLSNNTGITNLNLNTNSLTELDISDLTSLTSLAVNENQFTTLDVSANTALEEIYASDNDLTSFNGSGLPALSVVTLSNNALTSVTISQNTGLQLLYIDNQTGAGISTLDITNNLMLYSLVADNAGIETFTTAPVGNYASLVGTVSLGGNHITNTNGSTAGFLNSVAGNRSDSQTIVRRPAPTFGGGGGGSFSSVTPTQIIPSNPVVTITQRPTATNSPTPGQIYNRAYQHGLTTMSIEKARLDDKIQRYEVAKMIVNYAKNVEHKTIEYNAVCDISRYSDYNTFDTEMKGYITSICDLGLMGRKSPKSQGLIPLFRPFDYLGVDEFNIIIDRYLDSTPHDTAESNKRVDIMKFLMETATN